MIIMHQLNNVSKALKINFTSAEIGFHKAITITSIAIIINNLVISSLKATSVVVALSGGWT